MLKNSRNAAKEYQASVTKYPRNIELVGNYKETEDFDIQNK